MSGERPIIDNYTGTPPRWELTGDLTGTPPVLSMPRCATCIHWEADRDAPFGECYRVTYKSAGARVSSYDDFYTLPDFGCTEHSTARPLTSEDQP